MTYKKEGNCYKEAVEFQILNPTWILVHGIVTGQMKIEGIKYGHAWCEKENIAYDPVADMYLSADVYRLVGQAYSVQEYSYTSAKEMMSEHGHYGPWDKVISAAVHNDREK